MGNVKLLSLSEAIRRFVPDGASVVAGAGLEALIPFAAAYEIVRQRRTDLTVVAPISDALVDLLLGAGVVRRIVASWVGNVSAGSGYNFRRALEDAVPRAVEMSDHTNLTLALALHAAALGVPHLPTRSALGTDLLERNPDLMKTRCPFTGDRLVAVRALRPDVALLPVQRADASGGSHVWGNLGVIPDAARAAKRVVVLAEEIVPKDVIRSDPNRTIVPGFLVSAVVHQPMACHPSPCQGYYRRDHAFFRDYHERTKTREGFLDWLDRWVLDVPDHDAYLERVGQKRIAALREVGRAPSAPANFGA